MDGSSFDFSCSFQDCAEEYFVNCEDPECKRHSNCFCRKHINHHGHGVQCDVVDTPTWDVDAYDMENEAEDRRLEREHEERQHELANALAPTTDAEGGEGEGKGGEGEGVEGEGEGGEGEGEAGEGEGEGGEGEGDESSRTTRPEGGREESYAARAAPTPAFTTVATTDAAAPTTDATTVATTDAAAPTPALTMDATTDAAPAFTTDATTTQADAAVATVAVAPPPPTAAAAASEVVLLPLLPDSNMNSLFDSVAVDADFTLRMVGGDEDNWLMGPDTIQYSEVVLINGGRKHNVRSGMVWSGKVVAFIAVTTASTATGPIIITTKKRKKKKQQNRQLVQVATDVKIHLWDATRKAGADERFRNSCLLATWESSLKDLSAVLAIRGK
jgi:ribosomal protein L21